MPKLFISFTGTMYSLDSGRVTTEDLATGLFIFGCTRKHVMTPGDAGEPVEDIVEERSDLHELLIAALEKAEEEGRVRWRTLEDGMPSFAMVDELLTANGYKPLMSEKEFYTEAFMGRDYCYPSVEGRSTELEVIWRG